MMHIELTEGLGFSAAHFLVGHERCEHLHGHNWRVSIIVEGEPDEKGMVVDFLKLKRFLTRLCNIYDHRLLLPANNRLLKRASRGKVTRVSVHGQKFEFPSENVVWLPVINTTVEELARVIADEIAEHLRYPNVRSIRVVVEELPGQGATQERVLRSY